jgi:hypothetical protein
MLVVHARSSQEKVTVSEAHPEPGGSGAHFGRAHLLKSLNGNSTPGGDRNANAPLPARPASEGIPACEGCAALSLGRRGSAPFAGPHHTELPTWRWDICCGQASLESATEGGTGRHLRGSLAVTKKTGERRDKHAGHDRDYKTENHGRSDQILIMVALGC